jgi:FKBP-type peptidyl-prolyl cis-trans isomerase FkpA
MKRNCAKQMIKMRKTILYLGFIVGITSLLLNCNNRETIHDNEFATPQADLVPANKYLVKKNQQNIINFVHRRGWDMKETSTGLWYMIYKSGQGTRAIKGNLITLSYTVFLLDGSICYSSDSLGLKTFRIGSGHVESGLEEAALLLRQGDKARIIIPPYLAYGLLGDNNKIPPRSTILYDVTVIQLK